MQYICGNACSWRHASCIAIGSQPVKRQTSLQARANCRPVSLAQNDALSQEAKLNISLLGSHPSLAFPLQTNPRFLALASIGSETGADFNAPDLATPTSSPSSADALPPSSNIVQNPGRAGEVPEPVNATEPPSSEEIKSAKETILSILEKGEDGMSGRDCGGSWGLYADEPASSAFAKAIGILKGEKRSPGVTAGEKSLAVGQGTWEVFYAPHLSRISRPLGVRFDPIRYTLQGALLSSNVHYRAPVLGEGWLSASGTFSANGKDRVNVLFDSFWVDSGRSELRPVLEGEEFLMDKAINQLGKALFFPQFSVFPVLYVDSDIAVFQFTPLQSNIAARRIS